MQKTAKIIMCVGISVIAVLLAFLMLPLLLKVSWWWFFVPLIIIAAGLIIFLIIFLIRKHAFKRVQEEQPKEQVIDPATAKHYLKEEVMLKEYYNYFKTEQEQVTNEGSSGKPKTPVFHIFGKGYYDSILYYFFMNLNNPKLMGRLIQGENETEEKFMSRVKESIPKFALEPEILEPEIRETEHPDGTVTRTIKKRRQTLEQYEKEKEEQAGEDSEEV